MQNRLKSDWLNLDPVFYNTKTNKFSHNINDLIDYKNFSFDNEGFNNYLDNGFSVYGQTPIKNIKFLSPCQEIFLKNGKLEIKNLSDPIKKYYNKTNSIEDLIESLKRSLSKWEETNNKKVVIPLSGGLDSRLLLNLLPKKSNVFAFTYGISPNQNKSLEIVNAKIEASKVKVPWKQIELKNFHKYINYWNNIFGVSVHAHGMYQIEFYKKIKRKFGGNIKILSGIVGDLLAGGINIKKLKNSKDLDKISYNHGVRANSKYSKLFSNTKQRDKYWKKVKNKINDPYYQTLFLIRNKMILLSYLFKIPKSLGFEVWSPFIEPDIALKMMTLPKNQRKNRKWQYTFFKNKETLSDKIRSFFADKRNTLDVQGYRKIPLVKLESSLLSKYIDINYINWINLELEKLKRTPTLTEKIWTSYFIGAILRKLTKNQWSVIKAYNAYRVIKPIEMLLKKARQYK